MIHFTVGRIDKPTSLLGALRHFGVSSTLRRRIKHHGICTINGTAASTRDFVHMGDLVTVVLPETNPFSPEPIPFRIAYEDEYILVVDKPAGLLMHPTSGAHTGTLANAVAYYYQQQGLHCAYHPMHRLDKNTSGLCMIAKEPQIQSAFDKQDLGYSRTYLAIAEGYFPCAFATVRTPIARCPDSIIKRQTAPDGQAAWSDFTRLAANADWSLLQVTLHTGRTHQIRVHSSYLGHPLAGDDLYGGSRKVMQRQALHAYRLRFIHPMTGQCISVHSQLPEDMNHLITQAGWKDISQRL